MDWLRKAANWLGGLVKQANPVRAGVSTFQQASREFNRQRPRIEQATRQVARQIQPPKPRLDYQAAMRALQGMQQQGFKQAQRANPTNLTKPFLGVTVGDIARQVPNATKQVAQGGKDVAKGFVANPIRVGKMIAYPIIQSDMSKKLNRGEINYNTYNQIVSQAAQEAGIGINDSAGTVGRKVGGAVGGTALDILTAGTMSPKFAVGLKAGKLGKAAQYTAPIANRVAAGATQGGLLGAANLLQRDKITKEQAASDIGGGIAIGGAFPVALAGLGKGFNKLKGKNADQAIQARLKNRPANLQAIENNPKLSPAQRLALAQGDTGQAGLKLPQAQRDAMLQEFQAKMAPPKVRIVNGKKVFAPTYNPVDAPGNAGKFADNVNPRDAGKFTSNPTDGYQRVISQRELDIYNKTGKLPANPEGMTNVIKPGELKNIKGIGENKKFLVTFRDGVKLFDEYGPQASVKGKIDRKFVKQIEPYVPRGDKPVMSSDNMGPIKNTFDGPLPKQDPLEALKAEARKYKSAEEFVKAKTNQYHGTLDEQFSLDPKSRLFLTGDTDSASTYAGRRYNQEPTGKVVGFHAKDGKTLDLNNTATREKYVREVLGQDKNLKQYYDKIPENIRKDYFDTLGWVMDEYKAGKIPKSELDYYTNAQKNFKNISSKDVYANWDKIIARAKRDGYDYIKHTTEDPSAEITFPETVSINPGKSLLDEKQLTDLYNQATKGAKSADPLEALKAEARKYKSAEEFVKNNFVAHGTNKEILGNLQPTNGWYGKAVYTTDDLANASGRNGGGVTYFVNKPQGKLLEINAHGSKGGSGFTPQQYQDAIKNGYDGLKIKHDDGKTWYAMFNEQTPHTKQQLTDLYNQATKGAKSADPLDPRVVDYSSKPKEGTIRLYTNTKGVNVDNILKDGLKTKQRLQAYGADPSEGSVSWFETTPNLKGYGGNTVAVDVPLTARMQKVNDTQYMVLDDLSPEHIAFVDRPLFGNYRTSDLRTLVDKYGVQKTLDVFEKSRSKNVTFSELKNTIAKLDNQATKPKRFNELVPKSYLEPDAPKGKLTAKEKAMGKALGLSEADTLAAKQGGTGLDRTVNLDGTPIIPGAPKGQVKRGFVKSLQEDWGVPSKVSDQLPQGYKQIKNADTFAQAKQIVDSDPASLQRLLSKPKSAITELDQAQLQIHLRKAIEGDNFDSAKRIATKIDVNARQAGRTVQILAAWKKTTPEGALSHAYKVVEEANTKYPGKNFEVTPEKAKNIRRLAENIQKTTAGTRERQVAQALLEKEIRGIVPASIGRKISSIQTFAQLLNPKTAIRNVIGNAVFSGMENVSTTVGAGVDKIVGLGTKQRSVALPSLRAQGKGFLKGIKYGVEDTNLGIRTSGSETQFEIKPNVFKNKILKGVEKALGYELSVPDKAFYQAAFEDSMNNQMRAMKLSKPNGRVIEQANQEALYRTFQNDSSLATVLSKVKKGLNLNKEFGAGDFIMKYPRTPGNIAQAGLFDYSPLGGAQGIYRLGQGIRQGTLDPFAQREAVMQIGRGLTGTGLLAGGAALAKSGVVQGRPDTDKDVNNMDRSIGGGPYTFNVSALTRGFQGGNQPGDKILNYDWLQPTAIPVTMGANIANRKSAGDTAKDLIGTVDAGVQTLVDQPVLQGLARLFGSTGTQGRGLAETLLQTAQSVPSSFMPSLLNQVGQYTDPISRSTYDPNFLEGAKRQVMGRVPGLRTNLEPNMDTFGNERKMYEDNNFFNVFFNPAFQRTYQPTPEAQLVLDLNQATGETSQFPRVAPRKLTINGEQTTLTPEQITAFQKYTGEKTKLYYQSLNSDRRFQALSNEDKIKVMQNALTDIAAAGKIAILGQNPEGADKRVKAIVDFGPVDFIPKPKKVKQPKAPKARRGRRKSTRRVGTRSRRRGRVAKVVPKVPRLTSGIKTSGTPIRRVSAGRTPRIKFASAPKSSKTVKIKLG